MYDAAIEKQMLQLEFLVFNYLRYFESISIFIKIMLCNIFNLLPMQATNKFPLPVTSNYYAF